MDDCVFCKIVKGEIPSDKIYEDDYCVSFLSNRPINSGHALVVPKHHCETIFDVPDDILQKIILSVKKIGHASIKWMMDAPANAAMLTKTIVAPRSMMSKTT